MPPLKKSKNLKNMTEEEIDDLVDEYTAKLEDGVFEEIRAEKEGDNILMISDTISEADIEKSINEFYREGDDIITWDDVLRHGGYIKWTNKKK